MIWNFYFYFFFPERGLNQGCCACQASGLALSNISRYLPFIEQIKIGTNIATVEYMGSTITSYNILLIDFYYFNKIKHQVI